MVVWKEVDLLLVQNGVKFVNNLPAIQAQGVGNWFQVPSGGLKTLTPLDDLNTHKTKQILHSKYLQMEYL